MSGLHQSHTRTDGHDAGLPSSGPRLWSWLSTFLWGMVCAVIGSFPAFATGLLLDYRVSTLLGLCAVAVFAALGAGWAGNLAYPGTRPRLMPLLGVSAGPALIIAIIWVLLLLAGVHTGILPFLLLLMMAAPVAVTAAWGTRRFRKATARIWGDVLITFVVLVVSAGILVLTSYLASLYGLLAY